MPKNLSHVARFVPAVLRENKDWYIEFFYEQPKGGMARKRIYINKAVNRLRTKAEKRAYALREVAVINNKLMAGWNPDADKLVDSNPRGLTTIAEVFARYRDYCDDQERSGDLRHATHLTYTSTLSILESFSSRIEYIYQLDGDFIRLWLQWAREERGVSLTTAKNYRRWLRSFCSWCIDAGYMRSNPVGDVQLEASAHQKRVATAKQKSKYIKPSVRAAVFTYLDTHDRPLLLACYLCLYCFIRPHEIMQLRVGDIRADRHMIYIPSAASKNDMDGWVTLPDVVLNLMLQMGVLEHPSHWMLFNRQLEPADMRIPDRGDAIRDRWIIARKALRLPSTVRFYDLKHTGITDMLARLKSPRSVQLQARHHSLEQTEAYAQAPVPEANEEIRNLLF